MDVMSRTNHVTIQPVAPTCGAEVVGIDLLDPSPEAMTSCPKRSPTTRWFSSAINI